MNKVFLIGNLTRDPELTETSSGVSVCRFSIAVRRDYKNADGEYGTDFFNCQAWRNLAENVARYAHKGNKVAVSGSVEIRNYENNDGEKRTATEIQVREVEFLTPKQSDGYGDEVGHDVPRGRSKQPSDYVAPPRQQSVFGNSNSKLQAFDDDSDIPF